MDAFQFIKDVALDWERSIYLEAEPGEYVTVARKAKGTGQWFVGNVTGEKKHTSEISFNFLDPDKEYVGAPSIPMPPMPTAGPIHRHTQSAKSAATPAAPLIQDAVEGGGYAISFREAGPQDRHIKRLR